jgi:hypothetical protein
MTTSTGCFRPNSWVLAMPCSRRRPSLRMTKTS